MRSFSGDSARTVYQYYNASGRLSTVVDGETAGVVAQYAYDGGQLAQEQLGNGTVATYEYATAAGCCGDSGRLTAYRLADGATDRISLAYTHDRAGRMLTTRRNHQC